MRMEVNWKSRGRTINCWLWVASIASCIVFIPTRRTVSSFFGPNYRAGSEICFVISNAA